MGKKMIILIPALVLAAAALMALYFYKNGSGKTYSELQGDWMEVGSSSADTFTIKKNACLFTEDGSEKKESFTVSEGENYGLNPENALTLSFKEGEGPVYCDEYVYHTEEVDGHTIRILDSFMFEDDGRGLIVFCEFVNKDDLPYVGEDFNSNLYEKLNSREATPDYMLVE